MYKDQLPADCPPLESQEVEGIFFRIIQDNELSEIDFYTYSKLNPDNKRYAKLCIAHSISVFKNFDSIIKTYKEAKQRNKILGKYIAEIVIKKDYGKVEINNETHHCSFWAYLNFDVENVECLKITRIDEYKQ